MFLIADTAMGLSSRCGSSVNRQSQRGADRASSQSCRRVGTRADRGRTPPGEHLRLDPALAPEDATKIADLVRTMYESLQRQDRRLAVHLRAATTFNPPALRLLTEILGELQEALDRPGAGG